MSQLLFSDRRWLWMDPAGSQGFDGHGVAHCCGDMTKALTNVCQEHHDDAFACADMLVAYSPTFDEYGLIVHDGGASFVAIAHCPWCGVKLPQSQRDRWFDELEALGFSDPFADDIPPDYRSPAWRLSKDA